MMAQRTISHNAQAAFRSLPSQITSDDRVESVDNRLPAYREQVDLYARAVEQLLGKPVDEAWLVFLSARRIERAILGKQ